MTITLELSPDVEARLAGLAAARGLSLPEFLRRVLEEQAPSPASPRLSDAQCAEAWREAARGLPNTPPLSDEAISRDSLYGARG